MTQVIESGVQLFSRINSSSEFSLNDINPKLFAPDLPRPNEVIEIIGEFSKDLLLDFMIRCMLPKDLNPDWKDTGVVFINTTFHINILKITSAIDAHLKALNVQNRKPIIEKVLTNVTLLNCYEQIELTLRNLDRVIRDRDNVNLLIIDDFTSQFWIEKQKTPKLSLDQFSRQNFQLLQNCIKNLNLVAIFSRYQPVNIKKTVDLHVDYKIIGENPNSKNHFVVIDYANKTTKTVPFNLETFINFI